MIRSRTLRVAVALLVLGSVVAAVGVGSAPARAQQADAYVSISDVTVTPAGPAPGEVVTVSATVRNLQASSSAFTLEFVQLRVDGWTEESVTRLGTLAPGSSIPVPLTTTFESPGLKRIRVVAHGTDEQGTDVTVRYPVVVDVRERGPQVDLEATSPVADAETGLNVTVANGLDDPIRNVEVSVDGVRTDRDRRVSATIDAGAERTFAFAGRADRPGERELTASVSYTTANGVRRTTNATETVAFDPLRDEVALDVTRVRDGSALAVGLTNLGNAPLEDVTVRARADGVDAATPAPSVPPGERRTARLNLSDLTGSASVSVVATYDVGDRQGRVARTVQVSPTPGTIALTGVDVERDAGRVHITGSASNVGLTGVDSVVVRVVAAEGVEPAYPGKEYFVGTVPASDFVTFDVYARVGAGATRVPLRVTYLVDGQARERQFAVELDEQPAEQSGGDGGGLPVVPVAVAVVVALGVLGVIYLGWRNSRGGD